MATVDLGALRFNWRGTYAGGTAYVVDDVVFSGVSSYICVAAVTGTAPPSATYWALMVEGSAVAGGPSLGTNSIIRTNKTTIDENITFPAGAPFYNGITAGPVTITGSYTVTVPSGNTWTIV